jgi:alanine-alpha-ketoisovalerate/valine-pyruvate aminotransferase
MAMQTSVVSQEALALFRRRGSGEEVPVTDETRPLYRELAAEGLMLPRHSFLHGREHSYVFTKVGVKMVEVLGRISEPAPG